MQSANVHLDGGGLCGHSTMLLLEWPDMTWNGEVWQGTNSRPVRARVPRVFLQVCEQLTSLSAH